MCAPQSDKIRSIRRFNGSLRSCAASQSFSRSSSSTVSSSSSVPSPVTTSAVFSFFVRIRRAASSQHDADLAARLASLSPQQFRVLALVAQGLLNKQIADRLDVQERTVKAHVTAIFEKLNVRNRTQASLVLRELALSEPALESPMGN